MILYPGTYAGILQPWRHYVPLDRNHRNMAEVVEVLRDIPRAQEIVDTTYEEIAKNPLYSSEVLTAQFDDLIAKRATPLAPGIRIELPPMEEIAISAYSAWKRGYVEERIISAIVSAEHRAITALSGRRPAVRGQGSWRRPLIISVYVLGRGAMMTCRGLLHPLRAAKVASRRIRGEVLRRGESSRRRGSAKRGMERFDQKRKD
jgi:hypothetical protein